ncbi:putative endolysin [Escherichia phage vB_EcoS_ACG-M12]|uniref:Lysozyme n=2 Tax=Guelphvirus TaxID=2732062 RepID=K4FCE3_9CAUD|nr:endolysin [Escherichia phage vB_EcoS_ACG-M12]AFH19948.1 putative endolysin [Escherichia phage vB_EcoS_ACG-M12]UOX39742.1 putative endolysin [Escherichia phage vB_EcoS_SCS31]
MKQKLLISAATATAIYIAAPLIELVEGVENKPYMDIAGIPTVCSGVTGPDVVWGKTYSNRECRNLLEKHIQIHARHVQNAVTYPIAPQTRAALISFSYNVGGNAMRNSTAVRLINQGKVEQGCNALGMWNKARVNGKLKVVKGLVNRRNEEIKLCLSGLQR